MNNAQTTITELQNSKIGKRIVYGFLGLILTVSATAFAVQTFGGETLAAWEQSYSLAKITKDNAIKNFCLIERNGAVLKLYMESKGDIKLTIEDKDRLAEKVKATCDFQ
jgi:hypothetical protein